MTTMTIPAWSYLTDGWICDLADTVDIAQLRPTVDMPTVVLPAIRRPIAAIAATPEYVVDELGPWQPEQHQLEPARIHDALIGAAA